MILTTFILVISTSIAFLFLNTIHVGVKRKFSTEDGIQEKKMSAKGNQLNLYVIRVL